MSNNTSIAYVLLVFLMALGCGNAMPPGSSHQLVVAQKEAEIPAPGADEAKTPALARKIIYTCQIDVIVDDLTSAQQTLTSMIRSIQEQGGYLARQELTGESGSHRRGTWTIRVPLTQFDRFVSDLEQLGSVERNNRDAQDVTDAYTDLEARVRNKQSSEERLMSHLEKSTSLKDTLELERELTRVRGEVEQLQGQRNLLKNRTDLATVSLNLFERFAVHKTTEPPFLSLITLTFERSWNHLIAFGQFLLLIVVAVSPWAVALGSLVLPIWLVRRNHFSPPTPRNAAT